MPLDRSKVLGTPNIGQPTQPTNVLQTPQGPALQMNLTITAPFAQIFSKLTDDQLREVQKILEREIRARNLPI